VSALSLGAGPILGSARAQAVIRRRARRCRSTRDISSFWTGLDSVTEPTELDEVETTR
jgi:hypothetical protein